jgi:hypothetical protein
MSAKTTEREIQTKLTALAWNQGYHLRRHRTRIQKDLTTFRWECTDCPTVMYGFGTRSSAQLAAEKHEFSTLEFKRINR